MTDNAVPGSGIGPTANLVKWMHAQGIQSHFEVWWVPMSRVVQYTADLIWEMKTNDSVTDLEHRAGGGGPLEKHLNES